MDPLVERKDTSPPQFLRLAGHPVRWRLMLELAHSDRQVSELCRLNFDRAFLRVLVERLTLANSKLTGV